MNLMDRIRATVGERSPAVSWRARSAGLLVALVVLGLGVAGCGGSSGDSSGDSGAASAASGGGSSDSTKLVQYAQCMRSNGVPSFPDPVNGQLRLQVEQGGPLDPSSPQFQAAQKACKSLEPPGLQPGSGQSNQQQSQALKFAACMRQNGVADFPDPQDGRFLAPSGIDPNSPQFKAAMGACRKLLPGGVTAGGQ